VGTKCRDWREREEGKDRGQKWKGRESDGPQILGLGYALCMNDMSTCHRFSHTNMLSSSASLTEQWRFDKSKHYVSLSRAALKIACHYRIINESY